MRRTLRMTLIAACLAPIALAPIGCNNDSKTKKTSTEKKAEYDAQLSADVRAAIRDFKNKSPDNASLFDTSYGYVVFPRAGKGAAIVGIAHGVGEVFQNGARIGTSRMTQTTVGASVGGQEFAQYIFFQDANAMNRFKDGRLEFAATANAVVIREGGGGSSNFADGVAVYIVPKGGLMVDASIGGQGFDFRPYN